MKFLFLRFYQKVVYARYSLPLSRFIEKRRQIYSIIRHRICRFEKMKQGTQVSFHGAACNILVLIYLLWWNIVLFVFEHSQNWNSIFLLNAIQIFIWKLLHWNLLSRKTNLLSTSTLTYSSLSLIKYLILFSAVVVGAREESVKTIDDVLTLLDAGSALRHVGSTSINEQSSRSHCIFTLNLGVYCSLFLKFDFTINRF
jgi:Kinesin-like protein